MGLRKFQVSFFQTQLPVSAGVFNGSEFSNVQSAIASGMVNGAIAGGVSGAIFALINKENVLDAAISGSAMGFLVGGIVSGLKYHLNLSSQSTSSNKTGNGNDPTATAGGDGKVVEIDGKLYYIQNTPEGPVAVLIRTTPEVTVTAQANPKAQGSGGADLTSQFNQRIGAMEATFGAVGNTMNALYGGPILSYPSKMAAFGYMQYKGAKTEFMNPKAYKGDFKNGGYYKGEYFSGDDFGNYAYGVAARSMGLLSIDAVQGAGIYAIFSGSVTDWTNFYGFFDERKDTRMILRGYYGK